MANTLKTLRRFRGMTQEELAKETGITSRTIMSYENDVKKLRRASYENIKKLASALDVSVDDIFLDNVSDFLIVYRLRNRARRPHLHSKHLGKLSPLFAINALDL